MRALVLGLALLLGCSESKTEPVQTPEDGAVHPRLLALPEHRDLVLSRLDREPYASVYAELEAQAAREWVTPDPEVWDHGAHGDNAEITQANAMLAWLHDDEAAAARALEGFALLTTDFETNETWDVNIRMPHPLMGYAFAWDLLSATPYFPEAEADEAREKLLTVTGKFFDAYVLDDVTRLMFLGPAQNNHPIRTACAIATVGLAFPDAPEAEAWLDWSLSELDYLWGPDGQYVMADGGVSEGPFYYGFAFGVSVATFLAARNTLDPEQVFHRDCRNRSDVDPWTGHGCVDGEPFTWEDPLAGELFPSTAAWSLALRLPSGHRPPLGDAYFNPFNGGALLTGLRGEGMYRWDWESHTEKPMEMGHGMDLVSHHLVWLDDTVPAEPPPFRNRFLPDAGNAIFRSGWDEDDLWLLLVAEHGSARKTLHDHVDGTSFTLAAYGEYLLVDPGYYKPNELDNAVTADADSHNVVLVDGQGAPDKGLLTNWGDADAFLEHTVDGEALAYAEAHQSYGGVDIERSVVFVDQRYFVVADRIAGEGEHDFTWRLGGWAGYGAGGTFAPRPDGATWARELAGVDVVLGATAPGLVVVEPAWEAESPPHVELFDYERTLSDHGVIDGLLTAEAPGFLAVLAPWREGAAAGEPDGPLDVVAVPAPDGVAAWQVTSAGGTDVVLLREPSASSEVVLADGTVVATDGELVVVRLDGSFGLVARGSEVIVDGQIVAQGEGEVVVVE